MTREQKRRSGSAGAALLLIDLVNPMDFEGGDALSEPTCATRRSWTMEAIAARSGQDAREG